MSYRMHKKPEHKVAVCLENESEYTKLKKIVMENYNDVPTLPSIGAYSWGRFCIRLTQNPPLSSPIGHSSKGFYESEGYTILSFQEFLKEYVRVEDFIIHTTTPARKVLVQEVLINNGWAWANNYGSDDGREVIKPDMAYPYIFISSFEKKKFGATGNNTRNGVSNVITTEEFLENLEMYIGG